MIAAQLVTLAACLVLGASGGLAQQATNQVSRDTVTQLSPKAASSVDPSNIIELIVKKKNESLKHLLSANPALVNARIRDSAGDLTTPLIVSIVTNNFEATKFLLSAGADVRVRDAFDQTPLNAAASNFNLEAVRLLLEAPEIKSTLDVPETIFGSTPLQSALVTNDTEVVRLLFSAGARANTGGLMGMTAVEFCKSQMRSSACDVIEHY